MSKFFVHPDIKKAETLPAQFYRDPEVFQRLADEVFCKTWQFLGDQETLLPLNESHAPLSFLSPLVEEPLLLVRDQTL